MSISDIHTHQHPSVAGTAIVQLTPDTFAPRPGHYYSVGIHPWEITGDWHVQAAKLAVMALHPQVVMIGETGMDKRNTPIPLELQQEVFVSHVRLSELLRKPLIVHCVKAVDELLALRTATKATLPWVLHGFRGGVEQWRQLSRAGIAVSLGMHYDANLLRELFPLDLLLESDDNHDINAVYAKAGADAAINGQALRQCVSVNIERLLRGPYMNI